MKIEYEKIEQNLNAYGKLVLEQIRQDYGHVLSDAQKEYLNRISNFPNFIKVNKPNAEDIAFFSKQAGIKNEANFREDYIPSAHGGRTKQDDKIHIYPYSKSFEKCNSNDEILSVCVNDIVVHEIFHYFIRPEAKYEKDFEHFFTEGLVEYYNENFSKKHKLQKPKSNYNENVLAVQKIYSGLPAEWSKEQKERLIFQGTLEEIISKSKEGKNVLQEYKENKKFKNKISLLIKESTDSLGMSEKQINKFVSYYERISNKSEIVSSLYSNINEYFKFNVHQRDYYLSELKKIAPTEYQRLEISQNNQQHQINKKRVDLLIQKEQLQAQKQEKLKQSSNHNINSLTRTLKNNGNISSLVVIAITIIVGILFAFLFKG